MPAKGYRRSEKGQASLTAIKLLIAFSLASVAAVQEGPNVIDALTSAQSTIAAKTGVQPCGNLGTIILANNVPGSLANKETIADVAEPGLFDPDLFDPDQSSAINPFTTPISPDQIAAYNQQFEAMYTTLTGDTQDLSPVDSDTANADAAAALQAAPAELNAEIEQFASEFVCHSAPDSITQGADVLTQLGYQTIQDMGVTLCAEDGNPFVWQGHPGQTACSPTESLADLP